MTRHRPVTQYQKGVLSVIAYALGTAKGRLVTKIGSLPFPDVERAVAYSLEHEIPFLPELTARGDAMMNYVKDPGHLSCLDAFKQHRFSVVKVQCLDLLRGTAASLRHAR